VLLPSPTSLLRTRALQDMGVDSSPAEQAPAVMATTPIAIMHPSVPLPHSTVSTGTAARAPSSDSAIPPNPTASAMTVPMAVTLPAVTQSAVPAAVPAPLPTLTQATVLAAMSANATLTQSAGIPSVLTSLTQSALTTAVSASLPTLSQSTVAPATSAAAPIAVSKPIKNDASFASANMVISSIDSTCTAPTGTFALETTPSFEQLEIQWQLEQERLQFLRLRARKLRRFERDRADMSAGTLAPRMTALEAAAINRGAVAVPLGFANHPYFMNAVQYLDSARGVRDHSVVQPAAAARDSGLNAGLERSVLSVTAVFDAAKARRGSRYQASLLDHALPAPTSFSTAELKVDTGRAGAFRAVRGSPVGMATSAVPVRAHELTWQGARGSDRLPALAPASSSQPVSEAEGSIASGKPSRSRRSRPKRSGEGDQPASKKSRRGHASSGVISDAAGSGDAAQARNFNRPVFKYVAATYDQTINRRRVFVSQTPSHPMLLHPSIGPNGAMEELPVPAEVPLSLAPALSRSSASASPNASHPKAAPRSSKAKASASGSLVTDIPRAAEVAEPEPGAWTPQIPEYVRKLGVNAPAVQQLEPGDMELVRALNTNAGLLSSGLVKAVTSSFQARQASSVQRRKLIDRAGVWYNAPDAAGQIWRCNECSSTIKRVTDSGIIRHLTVHCVTAASERCPMCHARFASQSSVTIHINKVHTTALQLDLGQPAVSESVADVAPSDGSSAGELSGVDDVDDQEGDRVSVSTGSISAERANIDNQDPSAAEEPAPPLSLTPR